MDPSNQLEDFWKHLEERRLVRPLHLPYFVKWAAAFVRCSKDHPEPNADLIHDFLRSIQNTPQIRDWQVRQAEDAARLYLQFLRGPKPSSAAPAPPASPGASVPVVPASTTPCRNTTAPPDTQAPAQHVPSAASWSEAIDTMKSRLIIQHYSPKTMDCYLYWADRFREYADRPAPDGLDSDDAKDFLTHLALHERISASSQNQAFNALLFFYRHALRVNLSGLGDTIRARRKKTLPVVLSRDEVRRLLGATSGTPQLMARLVYGSGLRLMECVRLRVQDLDFDQRQLVVRSGKGDKDRSTLLPQILHEPLRVHLARVKRIHERDLAEGHGEVWLPDAVGRKYPNAGKEWRWQYVFPSATLAEDTDSGVVRRFHTAESTLQKAVTAAVRQAGILKRAGVHTLRHSFATHLLEDGVNIRIIQDLLGHRHVETTMIYTHVMQKSIEGVRSPLDAMQPAENGVR